MKSYIASLVALRLKITTKSLTMWCRISILFAEMCIPRCVAVKSTSSSPSSSVANKFPEKVAKEDQFVAKGC